MNQKEHENIHTLYQFRNHDFLAWTAFMQSLQDHCDL